MVEKTMDKETVKLIVNAGLGTLLAILFGLNMYFAHQERQTQAAALEKQAEALQQIADTYTGVNQ